MSYRVIGASDIPGVPRESPGAASDSLQWKKDAINRVGCWNATRGAWVGDQYCAYRVGKKPSAKQTAGNKLLQGLEIASLVSGAGRSGAMPSSGSPSWLMPVALGGGALLLVVLLAGKK